jgi:hypothetical protein
VYARLAAFEGGNTIKDTLEGSEEKFEQMGDEVPEDVRGRRVVVEVYDVVFDQAV